MASASLPSSSSTDRRWKYDVYLSFEYGDTGTGFTDLWDQLEEKGVETFMPEIPSGGYLLPRELFSISTTGQLCFSVPSTRVTAIEESRFAIVFLSPNYAASSWCLEDLTKICECMIPDKDRGILPVFYDIDPSDVRYQRGSFGEDFDRHERSGLFESDKIQQWRVALNKVASLSGWMSGNHGSELELVKLIVESVYSKVRPIEINKEDSDVESELVKEIADEGYSSKVPPIEVGNLSGWDSRTARYTSKRVRNIAGSVYRKVRPIEINKRILPVFYYVLIISVAFAIWKKSSTPDFIEDFEATTQAANGNSEPEPDRQWKHDVFLSFRGEDTRRGFLSHLYRELQNTKIIRTFKDDEQLKKGKDISQSLLTAIEESRFAIIVLSQNYAFSAWCLDELTKIFQCMEGKDTILPIFYHIDPSDVRYQRNRYEVAFTNHSSNARHAIEKVKQWRADLTKVGNLSGWDSKTYKSESELIVDIVKFLLEVLQVPRGDF